MRSILTILTLITTILINGQNPMENSVITWDNFVAGFAKEIKLAEDVHNSMVKSGIKDNCLTKMDFTFTSDKKEKLIKLREFIKLHYPYTIHDVKKYGKIWELNGISNEIPITSDNLMYWGLDMYKRGYEFDAVLEAYGGLFDPENQQFPSLEKSKAEYYFNLGVDCYNSGNLSGSIFNWSYSIAIDPKDPNAYYSRAIVKNELYTWKSALTDYDKAIEIAPDFASALINRGGLKDENGDYQGAIEDYQKVIGFANTEIENKQQAYFNLGNTKLNLKDNKGACEYWRKALEIGAEYAKERINDHCNK